MLCRRCEALFRSGRRRRPRLSAPLAVRPAGLEELAMVCDRCGTLLNGEDVAQRLLQKQEQLSRFGLIGFGPPLL